MKTHVLSERKPDVRYRRLLPEGGHSRPTTNRSDMKTMILFVSVPLLVQLRISA